MKLQQVIEVLEKEPSREYVAFKYDSEEQFLSSYTLSVNADNYTQFLRSKKMKTQAKYVSVWFEGGILFSTSGEEDSYRLNEVIEQIADSSFYNATHLNIMGYTADHIALQLFPELPDPDFLESDERAHFIQEFERLFNEHNH